jgi:hypothetical protein
MQTTLNQVCNTVQQLHNDTVAALQQIAQLQSDKRATTNMQAHNLQVLADMLRDAFKHIDDAACTASAMLHDD